MAGIYFEDEHGEPQRLSATELHELLAGSSIKEVYGDSEGTEIILGDGFRLKVENVHVERFRQKFPSVKCRFAGLGTPTAESIERAIHSLRQLYAIAFLVEAGRFDEAIPDKGRIDYEKWLLPDERLFIESTSSGSVWITAVAKTKAAFKSLASIAALFADRGREAILRRLEADALIKELQAKSLDVDIGLKQANGFIDLVQKVEKIKEPEVRIRAREALFTHMNALGKALPPPEDEQT